VFGFKKKRKGVSIPWGARSKRLRSDIGGRKKAGVYKKKKNTSPKEKRKRSSKIKRAFSRGGGRR